MIRKKICKKSTKTTKSVSFIEIFRVFDYITVGQFRCTRREDLTERETETARQRKTDKGRKARQIVIEKNRDRQTYLDTLKIQNG